MAEEIDCNVFFVVGDTGAALDLVAVAEELKEGHIPVKWFVDPNGRARIDVLDKRGIAYSTDGPEEYKSSLPKVLVC